MSLPQQIAALRAINYRLSSTPTQQLPFVARHITSSIWTTKDILRAPSDFGKDHAEASGLVHRFRTTLSSLLQDRTIQGRWAAVVLVKAAVEAGGIEALPRSGAWIKSLLGILKKPGPPTTRILTTVTLTTIFTLTWADTNLVRELTTPSLPTFVASCLSNVEKTASSASELQTVLEAFATLLPRHPAIFRTFENQIRGLLASILSEPVSDEQAGAVFPSSQRKAANRLLVLLHHSAAKQASTDRWEKTLQATVAAAHETCDVLFAPILENLSYNLPPIASGGAANDVSLLGLKPWTGFYSGATRLVNLLDCVRCHLELASGRPVHIQLSAMLRLAHRVLDVGSIGAGGALKMNPDATREEREALFLALPDVLIASLNLIDTILRQLDTAAVPIIHSLIEAVSRVLVQQRADGRVKKAVFDTLHEIIRIAGPAMSREDVADILPIIRACCAELVSAPRPDANQKTKANGISQTSLNANTALSGSTSPKHEDAIASESPKASAAALLPLLFGKLNQSYLPRKIRADMERTAVLLKHREALLAAVMNPFRRDDKAALQPSLLSFLTRLRPAATEVEALLRPRMPPIMSNSQNIVAEDANSLVGDEEDDDHLIDAEHHGTEAREDLLPDVTSHLSNMHTETARTSLIEDAVIGDELYSSTPQPGRLMTDGNHSGIATLLEDHGFGTKRSAEVDADESLGSKRPRTNYLDHTSSLKAASGSQHVAGSSTNDDDARITASGLFDASEAPVQDATVAGGYTTGVVERMDESIASTTAEDDLDSDFEIPEINPDPDTDPEDENDGG